MKKLRLLFTVFAITLLTCNNVFSKNLLEERFYSVSGCSLEGGSFILGTNVNNLDGDHVNASATYTVSIAEKGIYSMKLFYFTPVDASLTMYIDDVKIEKIKFDPTTEGSWDNSVKNVHSYINLDIGNHTIKIIRESDDINYVAIGQLALSSLNDTTYMVSASDAILISDAYLFGRNINNLDKDHIGSGATYSFQNIEEGTYIARLYYFTSADTATQSLYVEDKKVGTINYTACKEGSWDKFSYMCFTDINVLLKEGSNNLTIKVTEDDTNFAAISDLYLIRKDKADSSFYEINNNRVEVNSNKNGRYNIRLFYSSDTQSVANILLGDSKIADITYEKTNTTNASYIELTTVLPYGNSILNIQPEGESKFKYAVISFIEEIKETDTETNPNTSDSCIIYTVLIATLMIVAFRRKKVGVLC